MLNFLIPKLPMKFFKYSPNSSDILFDHIICAVSNALGANGEEILLKKLWLIGSL